MFEFLSSPEWSGIQGLLGVLAFWIAVLPYVPRKQSGSQAKKDEPPHGVVFLRYHCHIISTRSPYVHSFELVVFATNEGPSIPV